MATNLVEFLRVQLARAISQVDREEGQDMIEYALLAALISIVAIVIILAIGPYLDNLFADIINALNKT